MNPERIQFQKYEDKVISAHQAAAFFKDKMVVGSSGFTKAGDSKAVLPAFALRAEHEDIGITLITGASLGHTTDADLARTNALYKRMPFQVDPVMRGKINNGEILFIDQHLSETAELLENKHLAQLDFAIIEATYIDTNGHIIPTTSVGNSATFAHLANKIIIEINTSIPFEFKGIHDIFIPTHYPNRDVINITASDDRIGSDVIRIDPDKVVGIVFTEIPDSPAQTTAPDAKTTAIANHLLAFFEKEIQSGRLTKSLMPLQAGIGKVANAVLSGLAKGDFENLVMYSEVLQDSTFELMDTGKMTFASASSITVSESCYQHLLNNFDQYKDKIVLRPQNISNSAEVIRRLGIIGINTAIEFDIYGNVNSTHISGTKMMNGIGGSGDFARNAYLSIFVTQSASKDGNAISHVLPMVSHTDHTEHDVDILVTEQGLADLRGLAPRERAKVIIENCAHPEYREQLQDYYNRASERGGHTPHILEEAFNFHTRYLETGTMKQNCLATYEG
ncbi:succinate CoA transferase [Flavobacterium supellecticarium]|uniref:Succinate CoA transferase n=1 Tax=Flavobacterium supellecticarium TaxID=2565924 RepID=A0A4S3ZQQ2_9FLAO|nr:succinate CoA transferase [Flavobacterium supellecticarium]THF47875.1 succinate CoA transferase [Flavobacterium supellecticarium]